MNDNHLKKYLVGIAILTFFFLGTGILISVNFSQVIILKYFVIQVIIFLFINSLFHVLLVRKLQKAPQKFNQMYLILLMAKILLYLTFLVTFIFTLNVGLKAFLISFLILYICYSIYETILLSRYVKNKG